MTSHPTAHAVHALARPLRGTLLLAWCALGIGSVAILLGGLAWLHGIGWVTTPVWVLVAWALAGAGLVLLVLLARRALRRLTPEWTARRLEERGLARAGSIVALLDRAAPGTSGALFDAADRERADLIHRQGRPTLEEDVRQARRRLAGGGVVGALGLAMFLTAGPIHGPARALWHPGDALEAALAPITLTADSAAVDRGESVTLRLKATGRRVATLWYRGPGETWQSRTVKLDSTGRAAETVGPLRTDLFARLTAGGRSSDTVEVRVRIPAFLGSLEVVAHYPRYLGLEDEPMPVSGDTLLLPAGTALETSGEATAALAGGTWSGPRDSTPVVVRGSRFSARFTPASSGTWRLDLATAAGAALEGDSVFLPIRLVPDSAPVVTVPVPGTDTIAPVTLRLPLVIEVEDDHGVAQVEVESRRISRLGFSDPVRREAVSLPSGGTDHVVLNFDFDLNNRGLLPGDTIRYRVRATDNAPAGHQGESREYVLRLPTLSEVRAATREASREVGQRLDSLTQETRQLERTTEDLSRERDRPVEGSNRGEGRASMSYEAAQRAQTVAESQQHMLEQAEALQEALEELRRSAQAAGLSDPAWQERLREIQEQLNRALTPELREKLAELQRALSELDPDQAREALAQLAQAQEQLRQALERSQELFRRAALEGDMTNLAAESQELAREQEQWADQVPQADSNRAAAEERALAARADSLAAQLERLASQMGDQEHQAALEQASRQASEAAQQMQQAQQMASRGQRQQAQQRGRQAAQRLRPLGDQLDQQRNAMQQEWRQEVVEAMDQAMAETSRLTERQLDLAESLRRGEATATQRQEQGALEEGVQKLLEQMQDAAGKNAMVSPQIQTSLAAARQQMQRAREAISSGSPNPREAADAAGQAVDALNAAAYQLVRNRGQVNNSSSGSGLQEAMEQMQQMAAQQGGMNREAAGMLPMMGNAGMQEQLRQLGIQQRAMAERLERLRAQSDLPGAGDLAREARDLARRLESGRLDRETVERQERLFRRMLDAGRTLQGQEEDKQKERQSTTARGDSVHLPPALRSRLLDEQNRVRMPDWESLQRLSPEERRLVLEYFQRLSGAGDR